MRVRGAISLALVACLAAWISAPATTTSVAALEGDGVAWQLEELRQRACETMEAMVAQGCADGPDLLRCCSSVAAYEATACPCLLSKAEDPRGEEHIFARGREVPFDMEASARRCHLDQIGLGSTDSCTESRVAAANFPFLAEIALSRGDEARSRKVLESWIANQAFLVYESIDEQAAARKALGREDSGEGGAFPVCSQLALRAASECAPTWKAGLEEAGLPFVLTCCDALRGMNRFDGSCFCRGDVVNSLGGSQALMDLKVVARNACGFEIPHGSECH
ncbi:hypothetical protein HOP50_04g30500 [Chloropicon primus]|uniref:Bifunctional inhibitor/plant lipid transfer protein/seed storage helical domain-containing protein n=1 Tax=Chloropicon primus TaxID=1764295 RepID=A0A5B8MMJ9_9CHLO|nr:hypothetical protein A3770_04p30480 [Chloropicon primus]UPQ99741.1 hypothetical protein HOP50_04g30500 [Chloropicon primus]|mmetsp:Transcript_16608/g.34067  ORF Transcript_16608/g.34067 Transcript_16608/m.34067 type:complete len:279 (+) Transcript_16608:1-837(+)|eukprot:QDZ20530.1 hypothetical protein A3770_04p30480 [Chloropicon primus]